MICDNYGRPTLNLRISISQRCNLKCPYCHREGETASPSTEMSVEEITRIVRVAISLGVSSVKLTGGEPLLRSDILEIVKQIAELRGLRDLSMTTNGAFLAPLAGSLRECGLKRVNVNISTLSAETYRELNGGSLRDALDGVKAAVKAGLYPVKLNMLVLRGVNDGEISKMMKFAEQNESILQLIELEPINVRSDYYQRYHYPLNEIEARLKKEALEIKTRQDMQNRRIYFLPRVKVEVIHPIENTEFCARCTRLRVTSDGKLKPCLARNDNLVDVLTPMRNGADDAELSRLFIEAVKKREPYYKAMNS
ncbi:MAG: GTP 3',8-cyclase MoaA [Candidatus Bathyarchaeota archaeon]|nr:MAG: GTP 3',8-cyclase MoaA [Candidatus Bathyarchaeota archaeon]